LEEIKVVHTHRVKLEMYSLLIMITAVLLRQLQNQEKPEKLQ